MRAALGGCDGNGAPREISCDGVESGDWTIVLANKAPHVFGLGEEARERRAVISTDAHVMFPRRASSASSSAVGGAAAEPAKARVILEGLNNPINLGGAYRLMGCFGLGELLHVYGGRTGKDEAPLWDDVHRSALVKASARGCEDYVQRSLVPVASFLEHLAEEDRLPVVAIETATGAESIHNFAFPEACSIMVGAEGRGVQPAVVRALRPGFDSFVVVPMCGQHISLNVATALGIALYEYRRQWPGETTRENDTL